MINKRKIYKAPHRATKDWRKSETQQIPPELQALLRTDTGLEARIDMVREIQERLLERAGKLYSESKDEAAAELRFFARDLTTDLDCFFDDLNHPVNDRHS